VTAYASQIALADRMVRAKGKVTTFTRPGVAVDPVTQMPAGSEVTFTAPLLALPLSAGKAAQMFGASANVSKARLSCTMALSGVSQSPQEGDRFTWAGVQYRIITAPELLNPDGDTAIMATFVAEA